MYIDSHTIQIVNFSGRRIEISGKKRNAFNAIFLLLVIFLSIMSPHTASSQSDQVTITLVLISGMEYLEDTGVFRQFEQDHPGIHIHVEYRQFEDFLRDYIPPATSSLEDHLQGTDKYALSGDVLLASIGPAIPPNVSIESTRAGYFLNLNPLIQADSNFDPSVFYMPVWQSANWDNGTWLMPLAAQIQVVIYNAQSFDTAGITYPDTNWDVGNYVQAISALSAQNNDGTIANPGYIGFNASDYALMYTLIGSGLYDPTILPSMPRFDRADVRAFAEQWVPLYRSGVAYNPTYNYSRFSVEDIPVTTDGIEALKGLVPAPSGNLSMRAALMPGNRALVTVRGLAVSGYSQYPEMAYALAKYLANDFRVADALVTIFSMTAPARSSYLEADNIEDAPRLLGVLSLENQVLLETALQVAVPFSEVRFFDYFRDGLIQAANSGSDIETTLQDAQIKAESNLQAASERRGTLVGTIATPIPSIAMEPGEIAIHFWINAPSALIHQSTWNVFAQEFAVSDPQVGQLMVSSEILSLERAAQKYDCFYLSSNAVPSADLNSLVNLDPLISADSSLSTDGLFEGALVQVQRDNQTWAYPLDIRPQMIWYASDVLSQAGIIAPSRDWTMSQFYDTINQLVAIANDDAVLGSSNPGTTLLELIAANGGVLFDDPVSPLEVDFTNHTAVIQQVLDLARNGYIFYRSLTTPGSLSLPQEMPMLVDTLGDSHFNLEGYVSVQFPHGSLYTPISFDIGAAYISRSSPNPEACYRLFSAIAQRPDLLPGIPIRQASVSVDTYTALSVEDTAMIYDELVSLLEESGTVIVPNNPDPITTYWLFRAFDRYVLEGANLEDELTQAEQFTREYLVCKENILSFDSTHQTRRAYNRQHIDCAVHIDPSSQSFFALVQ